MWNKKNHSPFWLDLKEKDKKICLHLSDKKRMKKNKKTKMRRAASVFKCRNWEEDKYKEEFWKWNRAVKFVLFCFFFWFFKIGCQKNLFVTSVIVLNDHGSCPFLLLFLGPLASYVGSIGLLDGLGRLVEFALFVIRQRQVRKIANK